MLCLWPQCLQMCLLYLSPQERKERNQLQITEEDMEDDLFIYDTADSASSNAHGQVKLTFQVCCSLSIEHGFWTRWHTFDHANSCIISGLRQLVERGAGAPYVHGRACVPF